MDLCLRLPAAVGSVGTMVETRFPWYFLTLLFPVPWPPPPHHSLVPTWPHPLSPTHPSSRAPGWLLRLNLPESRAPEQGGQWLDESGTEKVGIATGSDPS